MVLTESQPSTASSSLKLIIKAANQKYDDFIIENMQLEWTIKHLKKHINENYPTNPECQTIRLIYSGKLLHDHWTLKECIRHNSEVTSHIIHMVHSANNVSNGKANEANTSTSSTNTSVTEETDLEMENELTPNSSYSSSDSTTSLESSSSESSSPTITSTTTNQFSHIQNNLNNMFIFQQRQRSLPPKEQYNQILNNLTRYYESLGVQVNSNPWYSSYVQQLALYNYMYSNYMQSLNSSIEDTLLNTNFAQFNEPAPIAPDLTQQQAQAQPAPPVPPQQPARNRQANNNNDVGERDDDWLSMLHNIVSFLVLFSIIYYYSSLERFLLIISIVFILILYHNGWLSLQRRQVNPRNNQRQNPAPAPPRPPENGENQQQDPNEAGNVLNERENQQQQQQQNSPNILRLTVTFFLTFFTSLIPERPRVVN